jgi:hypothetical protein
MVIVIIIIRKRPEPFRFHRNDASSRNLHAKNSFCTIQMPYYNNFDFAVEQILFIRFYCHSVCLSFLINDRDGGLSFTSRLGFCFILLAIGLIDSHIKEKHDLETTSDA